MSDLLKAHIEKITPISNEEFEYIYSHFTYRKLKSRQFLINEGDTKVAKFFVVKGSLKSYYTDKNGKDHILQFAEEDWWITDYKAFFEENEATITIDCIKNCELLSITKFNLEKLCSELHKMEHFFRVKSNSGYVASQERLLSMLNLTPIERYNNYLKLYPTLIKSIPKYLIASYLGISRERLSRLISARL